jgi:hypothetical protein
LGIQIYAVRIGDKYGPEYEEYVESKLGKVNWIREPFNSRVELQWNKLKPMTLKIDEPVVVVDIDIIWTGNYMDIINYPIKKGEYLSLKCWWKDTPKEGYSLQGGFQKYYPKDARYIYEKFMFDPWYWQQHYIKNGTTIGPVNGEQYFIEDVAKERLELKFVPEEWHTRWIDFASDEWIADANKYYPGEWLYKDDKFNPKIRLIHFSSFQDPRSMLLKAQLWN